MVLGRAKKSGAKEKSRLPLGLFSAGEAISSGIPRVTFYRLLSDERIVRHERGIYQNVVTDIDPSILDLAIACKHFGPQSSIGGLTALFRYGLIEQVPSKIWIVTPPSVKQTGIRYRVIRSRLDSKTGVVSHKHYRIADIERAIVEALRYSTKVGLSTAIRAAREAVRLRKTTESKILRRAKEMGLEKFVLRHWDAIIVE